MIAEKESPYANSNYKYNLSLVGSMSCAQSIAEFRYCNALLVSIIFPGKKRHLHAVGAEWHVALRLQMQAERLTTSDGLIPYHCSFK